MLSIFSKKEVQQDNKDQQYLEIKLDFFEKSNRIHRYYPDNRDQVMQLFSEILERILQFPVSICINTDMGWKVYGESFKYVEEYAENLKDIKDLKLISNLSSPVITIPHGFLIWHNPNYILTKDEDFLMTACSQIALVEENISHLETIKKISITDPLTQLYNRRHLMECLDKEMSRCKRAESSLGFLIFDIDKFKSFNDTFGHQVGDEVLQALANLLKENLRKEDILARYGGEEFCVVIADCDREKLWNTAEKVRVLVESQLVPPKLPRQVTVSIGGSLYPSEGETSDEFMKLADDRLYQAKESGRNKSVTSS